MANKYEGNDFLWSPEGDLIISALGDIDSTSRHAGLLSLVQEIQTRIRSDVGDWTTQPSIGANLSDLVGRPCNQEVAEAGKVKIQASLTRGGFLPANSFKVRYIPISQTEVVYNILCQAPGTSPDQIINLSLAVDLSNADISMIYDKGIAGAYNSNLSQLATPRPKVDIHPKLLSAVPLDSNTILLTFDVDMLQIDGTLTDSLNYIITGDGVEYDGPELLSAVMLTFDEEL